MQCRILAVAGASLLMAMPAAGQVTIGPHTWWNNPGNDHWYALTDRYLGFWDAEAQANSVGGNLASVTDAGEMSWMASTFFGDLYWIGFYQPPGSPEPADGWVWTTGEPTAYTNWTWFEPNDAGGENAALFNWGGPGEWNDVPDNCCGAIGIMEVNELPGGGTVTPEPVTLTLLGTGLAGVAAARRRRNKA